MQLYDKSKLRAGNLAFNVASSIAFVVVGSDGMLRFPSEGFDSKP